MTSVCQVRASYIEIKKISELQIRELVNKLLRSGTNQHQQLNLRENIDLKTILFDRTYVPLNIHHPVDC
jgi:hypothetical protein